MANRTGLTCAHCGTLFDQTGRGPVRKYCRSCASTSTGYQRIYRAQHLDDMGGNPPRPCERCKKLYTPNPRWRTRQRFCSQACRLPLTPHSCPVCLEELTGTNATYCSARCREAALSGKTARKTEYQRQRSIQRECSNCGKTYKGSQLRCFSCRTVKRAGVSKPCEWCGQMFISHPKVRSKYCSAKCSTVGTSNAGRSCPIPWTQCPTCEKWRTRKGPSVYCQDPCLRPPDYVSVVGQQAQGTCDDCGTSYTYKRTQGHYGRCCPACQEKRTRESKRDAKRRRKARKQGVPTDRYKRLDIFERDNWTCQLCGYPLNPDATFPDYEYPTIDHIIPLARGGHDTTDNVQAAHFLCNSYKRDQLIVAAGSTEA